MTAESAESLTMENAQSPTPADNDERHTALGDARACERAYDLVMGVAA